MNSGSLLFTALCNGSSPWAWSKGRRLSGAVLHSSREPGVRRPCSDFMDLLRRLINCRIIIVIIIIIIIIIMVHAVCLQFRNSALTSRSTQTRRAATCQRTRTQSSIVSGNSSSQRRSSILSWWWLPWTQSYSWWRYLSTAATLLRLSSQRQFT